MPTVHRVLWGEGMFLRPQHFQQQQQYLDARLGHCLSRSHAYPWGIASLKVDDAALETGMLRIDGLEAIFQDGTLVRAPGEDPLPAARGLESIPGLGIDTVIHLCLPSLKAFGGNCQVEASGPPSRFRPAQVPALDLFTGALESELTVLHANLRFMAESENRDGMLCIPILRLVKDPSGRWHRDDLYVPPSLQVGASELLPTLIRRLLDICQVKSQALAAGHRERAHSVAGYGTQDVASFWLLHTVHRSFPLLSHALRNPSLHPEELYLVLAQMAAELLTFSSTLGLSNIPPYRHDAITETFERLEDLIRSLLDTVISARYGVVALESLRPGFLSGRIEDAMVDSADFYLSVASEHPAAQIIETIPYKLKVGSPDDVEKILHSALPGIRLVHATQTPAAIPVRIGNHYFALEKGSAIYEHMLKSRSVCIYKPQSLPEMKLELFAVYR